MPAILFVLIALGAISALRLIFAILRFVVAVVTRGGGSPGYWEQALPPIEIAPRLQGEFPKSVLELRRRCAEEQRRRILARALSGFARTEPKRVPTALEHPETDSDRAIPYGGNVRPKAPE